MGSTIKEHPPRTLMEVFKSLPEGTWIQLIENNLIMSPSFPGERHQKILGELIILIITFVKKHRFGEVFLGPLDVYLDNKNAFQSDIIFINKDRLHLIKEDGLRSCG